MPHSLPTRLSEAARQCGSLSQFAQRHQLPIKDVADWIHQEAFLHQSRIYTRLTQFTPIFKPGTHDNLMSLRAHIERDHAGQVLNFAQHHQLDHTDVHDWLHRQAVWLSGEVCVPAATIGTIEAVPLRAHIRQAFKGNNTAFARHYDKTQQQVSRWVLRDCYWALGEVHMRRTNYTGKKRLIAPTHAIRLRDLIMTNYEGSEDAFFQAYRHHGLGRQQLDRFLGYNALWIHGEIYKNQSKFQQHQGTPY